MTHPLTDPVPDPLNRADVGDAVGPHGVVVYAGPERTPDWYAARRAGITATDLPKILGDHYPGTQHAKGPLDVYADKVEMFDRIGPEDETAMSRRAKWGLALEEPIARTWAEEQGVGLARVGTVAHREHPWMRASPDFAVTGCPDADDRGCGLQVKTRSAFTAGRWRDDTPDAEVEQCTWEAVVTGWGHVHLVAVIDYVDHHRAIPGDDLVLSGFLVEEAEALWRCVQDRTPPQVPPDDVLTRFLDRLADAAGGRTGTTVITSTAAARITDLYTRGRTLIRQGEGLVSEAKNLGISLLDGGEEIIAEDGARALATYREQDKTSLSADQRIRLKAEHPRIYARLVREGFITTTTHRVWRVARSAGTPVTDTEENAHG